MTGIEMTLTFNQGISVNGQMINTVILNPSTRYSDNSPRGNCKWSRTINKNVTYMALPTDSLEGGGFGYDLGFVEDTFTFNVQTASFVEYTTIMNLIKLNSGVTSGTLSIAGLDYNVLVKSGSASGQSGNNLITYSITMVVVST